MNTDYRLLQELTDDQIAELSGILSPLDFQAGEVIVHEGESGDQLFLIEEGEVEVLKSGQEFRVAKLGPGDDFGAMSLLDEATRSASVRAITPVKLYSLPVEDLRRLSHGVEKSTYAVMIRNLLQSQMRYLRETTDLTVTALRKELAESKARMSMGSFLTVLVGLMCFYGYCLRISLILIEKTHDSTPITVGLLLVFALALLVMIMKSGYPLSVYGLNMNRWQFVIGESLLWSLGFIAVITILKWIALNVVPAFAGQPLFSMRGFVKYSVLTSLGIAAVYSIFAPAQEFIARGALQSSFQQFLSGKWVTAKAILLSTLLFGTTHLHMSIGYALLAIVPSIFWGIMYARQQTLLGVSLSHLFIGLYIAFFLGFPGLP
ncbi:MAG: cyclic nucleotide-binding domain-containing protein [Deltaproteobacteria bacterium]|nr:cyclic nucleotide-binding domain-containing protein [Deltaproteobacteria bacterium]